MSEGHGRIDRRINMRRRNERENTMKTGRNLQEVLVELNRQKQAKQDFISPAQGMRLREDGHTFEINHLIFCRTLWKTQRRAVNLLIANRTQKKKIIIKTWKL